MATNPYDLLGVSKSSTAAEIKSAYRKLAKKFHPDVNPGRKDIEQKFKEITAAYDLLSDDTKRAKFDRGEVDGMGNDTGYGRGPFGGGGAGAGGGFRSSRSNRAHSGEDFSQFGDMGDMDDILSQFFGGGKQRGGAGAKPGTGASSRGGDVTYAVTVPFTEAALGGKRRVMLTNGKEIEVTIPPGADEGSKLRLRGQGTTGPGGAGDAIIEIHVEPHPYFARNGNNVTLEAPISLPEALSGATIRVPTLDGYVSVKVPKGANSGTSLRLKGKGVVSDAKTGAAGDMFVKLRIMLPETPPDDLTELIEKWAKKNAYDPREKLGWG